MSDAKCPSCGTTFKIKDKKTGLWWGIGCLIAALGLPVIIAIIGLLAAIAIPAFAKARETSQRAACVNNLHMIEAAKEAVAQEKGDKPGVVISDDEISPYLKSGLTCPAGGEYTFNPVGQKPSCSVHGESP